MRDAEALGRLAQSTVRWHRKTIFPKDPSQNRKRKSHSKHTVAFSITPK
jgi:hypothetical protein